MANIHLSNGEVALVDDEDYPKVMGFGWYACGSRDRTSYVEAQRDNRTIRLHRLIMDAPDGVEVDHINRDGLDNRRENLRLCSHAENGRNSYRDGGKSRFKGVTRRVGRAVRWKAQIITNGVVQYLGTFKTEEEAARAYDAAALRMHGEFARTNAMNGLFDAPDDTVRIRANAIAIRRA